MTLKKILYLICTILFTMALAVSCGPEEDPGNNPPPPAVELTKLEITSGSVATQCYVGDTVSTTAISGVATYSDGTTKNLVASDFTVISAPDTSKAGSTTLVVGYENKSASVTITVKEHVVSSMTITGLSTEYVFGTEISTANLAINVTYVGGKQETITYSENSGITLTLPNTRVIGDAVIQVFFLGKKATFNTEIIDPVASIELDTPHRTFVFNKNSIRSVVESVLANLAINAVHVSGKKELVTYEHLTVNFDQIDTATLTTDPQSFEVSYEGFKTTATYTITEGPKFSALTLDPANTFKTSYLPGATLDNITALKVKAILSSGHTIDAVGTDSEYLKVVGLESIDTMIPGVYNLTVTYTDDEASISMQLPVTVYGVTDITVTGIKTNYKIGEAFDSTYTGVTITIVYENGDNVSFEYADIAEAAIILSEFEICGSVNTSIAGKYSISFKYLDKESNVINIYVKATIIPDTDGDENVTDKTTL